MKGVRRVKPMDAIPHHKSKILFNMYTKNGNSKILDKFLKRNAKSTERQRPPKMKQ